MGLNITRTQQVKKVLREMLKRAADWSHIGRTISGRVTVARAIILSCAWYTLSAIATDINEAREIQRLTTNFINRQENITWQGDYKRGNLPAYTYYNTTDEGGWGMTPPIRTIQTRKLALLQMLFKERANGIHKPWHTFVVPSAIEAQNRWAARWQDILLWHRNPTIRRDTTGDWAALSPWWQSTLEIWTKTKWRPIPNSLSISELQNWPVWNNRLLMSESGLPRTLTRMGTHATTKEIYGAFRNLGFIRFKDFLNNGTIRSGTELHFAANHKRTSSRRYLRVRPLPLRSCKALSKHITTLWATAKDKWMQSEEHYDDSVTHEEEELLAKPWISRTTTPFQTCSNKQLADVVKQANPRLPATPEILINGGTVKVDWKLERSHLQLLAPAQKDLIMRLIRNGLPLGYKRLAWNPEAQTKCPNCDSSTVETAEHLLWSCTFAKEIWRRWTIGWTSEHGSSISWKDVVWAAKVSVNNGSRQPQTPTIITGQIWTIIRACVTREIWLERNRRVFDGESYRKDWKHRHIRASNDVKAHLESALRRTKGKKRARISKIISTLIRSSPTIKNMRLNTTQRLTA